MKTQRVLLVPLFLSSLFACACVASPGEPETLEGDDTAVGSANEAVIAPPSQYVFSGSGNTNWAACGGENGSCNIAGGVSAIVRYGIPGNYFYFGTSGESSVPCNDFEGDPAWGQTKACEYTTNLSIPYSFNQSVSENQYTYLGAAPVWFRYGVPGKWYETVQSDNVYCSNDTFGYDPAPGSTKSCQVGPPIKMDPGGWQPCASEGQACNLPTNLDGVLLRYGAGTGIYAHWTYRIADVSSITCDNNNFNTDPAPGATKSCQYVVLPAHASTTGAWTDVADCEGCGKLSRELSWGTSRTTTQTDTSEWSTTVTTSMQGGITLEGVGTKVSASVATTYGGSSSFSNALNTSYGASSTAECDQQENGDTLAIYQFSTDTDATCVDDGGCAGQTYTADFVCVHNPPAGYLGPACTPGNCANALCTTCLNP